ncbi:LysM repeat protein [Microbacterium marinum]|jgi:hypothetical protein|uniref:LysM repeat protein n=1 Tax=Microbacterium marinum TaxID=421115 RepID=A0A7W7FK38_9MICO|nr:LysM domain-containing protein [Microbacterium marinum]MBB4665964.1 LysM repeat protein [Microbacterium marinum]
MIADGDTLRGIAMRYCLDLEWLAKLNGLEGHSIYKGDALALFPEALPDAQRRNEGQRSDAPLLQP